MEMTRLTDEAYWNDGYRERGSIAPVSITGSANYRNLKLFELLDSQGLANKRILEIGGGGSSWLAYLASRFRSSRFVGLDYSDAGCQLLKNYADENDLHNLDYWRADFFTTDASIGQFDLVYSLGVVEHFSDLAQTLTQFQKFLTSNSVMITIIPNMAGILGRLTKLYNRDVYDKHVPYDLDDLVRGHLDAGMIVQDSGYICSNNFGVLSSCFDDARGFKYSTYKWLTRVSRLSWIIESKSFDLPKTAYFSPYSYTVARKPFPDQIRDSSTTR